MLEAYGYTVRENKGGRTVSVDPVSIMEELHRRYPNGAGPINLQKLSADNTDIPWKTLSNNATEYFGKTLVTPFRLSASEQTCYLCSRQTYIPDWPCKNNGVKSVRSYHYSLDTNTLFSAALQIIELYSLQTESGSRRLTFPCKPKTQL